MSRTKPSKNPQQHEINPNIEIHNVEQNNCEINIRNIVQARKAVAAKPKQIIELTITQSLFV